MKSLFVLFVLVVLSFGAAQENAPTNVEERSLINPLTIAIASQLADVLGNYLYGVEERAVDVVDPTFAPTPEGIEERAVDVVDPTFTPSLDSDDRAVDPVDPTFPPSSQLANELLQLAVALDGGVVERAVDVVDPTFAPSPNDTEERAVDIVDPTFAPENTQERAVDAC